MTTADPWLFTAAETPPEATTDADESLATAFARCLSGADGRRVLDHLRARTLQRALGPDAPEAALRHLEGQRALVAQILALVARGGGDPFSRS